MQDRKQRHRSEVKPFTTAADTDGELDWRKVMRLSWRPAWSIRSRRGSVAPFLDMIREWRGGARGG